MEYEKTLPFAGDSETALKAARSVLMQTGFEVTPLEDGSFQARHSGSVNTRQNPLKGATTVVVAARGDSLALGAELGGVRKLRNFLIVFIGGMALLFLVGFGIFFLPKVRAGEMSPFMLLVPVAPFFPWPVGIPLLVHFYRSRVKNALATLLENARTVGKVG